MGITAENVAEKWGLTREQLDEFSVASQNKAEAAIKGGKFKDEIVPVEIPQRKGDPIVFDTDEHPKFGSTMEKVAKLKPAFKKDGGVVTAANASGINDSGAAVVVMSAEKAAELGLKPLVKIVSYASAGVDPQCAGRLPYDLGRAPRGGDGHHRCFTAGCGRGYLRLRASLRASGCRAWRQG